MTTATLKGRPRPLVPQPALVDGCVPLTDAHRAFYPEWNQMYHEFQTSTDPTDQPEVERRVRNLYKLTDHKQLQTVAFAPSPMIGVIASSLAKTYLAEAAKGTNDQASILGSLFHVADGLTSFTNRYFSTIEEDDFRDEIRETDQPSPSYLFGEVEKLVYKLTGVDRTARVGTRSQKLVTAFEEAIRSFSNDWNGGNTWAFAHAHLTFFDEVMGIDLPAYEAFSEMRWLNENSGCRLMREEFCVVIDRPMVLKTRKSADGVLQLHAHHGPSVAWSDGFSYFHHDGVMCPPWMMRVRDEELNPRHFTRIKNTTVRAAFCRKVGMERIFHACSSKVIAEEMDGLNNYQILEIEQAGDRFRYLAMDNRSVPGVRHVEGLTNEIETIQQAINFRNGFSPEEICDETGCDWVQQGDVVIYPEGATKFKSRPAQLT